MKPRRRAAGFTLLEVAVALSILGIGIVSCLQIFGASLRMQDRSNRMTRAVLHARAAMDALIFDNGIREGERDLETTAEGFRTHVSVHRAGAADGLTDREFKLESEYTLLALQVDVSWQDGVGSKIYTVRSMRSVLAEELEDR